MAIAGGNDKTHPRRRRRRTPPGLDFEGLFHLFIENVRDYAVFILDPRGSPITWNAGVQRMLGYDEDEFLGLDMRRIFRPDEQDQARRERERAAATGRSEDERWHVRKDRSELWVTGVLTALRDADGRLRGFAKIMRDSTALRHAELERDELLRASCSRAARRSRPTA